MVLGDAESNHQQIKNKDPMQLAQVPLAVPYLLNPVGIVGLVTISAEAQTLVEFAIPLVSLGAVLALDVAVFHWSRLLSTRLSEERMLVTEKVFGFLIAAIAVQLVLDGVARTSVGGGFAH